MRLKRNPAALWLFLLIVPAWIASAFASDTCPSLEDLNFGIGKLEEDGTWFAGHCLDSQGSMVPNRREQWPIELNGDEITCEEIAVLLNQRKLEISDQIQCSQRKDQQAASDCATPSGSASDDGTNPGLSNLVSVTSRFEGATGNYSQRLSACAQDISCSLYVVAPAACKQTRKGDSCLVAFLQGLYRDLVFNVQSLWELVHRPKRPDSPSQWKTLDAIEDKESDVSLAASSWSDGEIARFLRHPAQYVSSLAGALLTTFKESVETNFLCEKWEGVPHFSTCSKPFSGWENASCGQWTSAACGVLGYYGGEISTLFLTGGTAAVGKLLFKASGTMAEQLGVKLAESFPELSVAAGNARSGIRSAGQAATQLAEPAWQTMKGGFDRTVSSKGIRAVASAAQRARESTKALRDGNAFVRYSLNSARVAIYPLKALKSVADRSFPAGYEATDRLLQATVGRRPQLAAESSGVLPAERISQMKNDSALAGIFAQIPESDQAVAKAILALRDRGYSPVEIRAAFSEYSDLFEAAPSEQIPGVAMAIASLETGLKLSTARTRQAITTSLRLSRMPGNPPLKE